MLSAGCSTARVQQGYYKRAPSDVAPRRSSVTLVVPPTYPSRIEVGGWLVSRDSPLPTKIDVSAYPEAVQTMLGLMFQRVERAGSIQEAATKGTRWAAELLPSPSEFGLNFVDIATGKSVERISLPGPSEFWKADPQQRKRAMRQGGSWWVEVFRDHSAKVWTT